MVAEGVGQLNLVLPSDVQAVDDAEALEQHDGAVDAGPVGLALAGGDDLVHGQRFLVLQDCKNLLAAGSQALALSFKDTM